MCRSSKPFWLRVLVSVNGVELVLSQFCLDGEADLHCVHKIDWDTAGYKQERYDDISNEMKSMLIKVGGKKISSRRIRRCFPFLVGLGTFC